MAKRTDKTDTARPVHRMVDAPLARELTPAVREYAEALAEHVAARQGVRDAIARDTAATARLEAARIAVDRERVELLGGVS